MTTAFGTGNGAPAEVEDDGVVLGEMDLAERGEILRNQFRRITPGNVPLAQDIGTWPTAWEEFDANWNSAATEREYGAWVVPVELTQDNVGATVVRDGAGLELWRGTTDFARPESAGVVLTGGLVAEEDWTAYEAVRGVVESLSAEASRAEAPVPVRSVRTNGLRFTSHEWTTNNTFRLGLAYEVDTNVDVFAFVVAHTSAWVVATWTNDEDVAVTDTNLVWYPAGPPFNGMESQWEWRGTVSIDNGVAEFEDSGFAENLGRLRCYAAAVAQDSDGDGLSDGEEAFVSHTNPGNPDSDGDGMPDGMDTFPVTSNVWFVALTSNGQYYQRYLGECGLNAPKTTISDWSWIVLGAPPTSDSVLLDVRVSGFADDYITVNTNPVDAGRGPRTYNGRSVTNEIGDLQARQFTIGLVDWPDANYSGPNEVRIGTSETAPFEVGWVWGVPMALRGPEYVCVGGTAQFVALGAGGGPYTWSVDTDPAAPAAEIDGNGLLTALAPGIATVTVTAGEAYSVSQAVNVVQIDFLDSSDNVASSLKIGKWENAFTMVGDTVTVKDNFIDLDPDRFKVRIIDTSKTGDGSVSIDLSTISVYPVQGDNPTGLELHEIPYASGTFISTNQLLVADDCDDDFHNSHVVDDDAPNDRTHRIGLGGKVLVRYPRTGDAWTEKEIAAPKHGTVHVIPIILRDDLAINDGQAVVSETAVRAFLKSAHARFSQVGIDLTWSDPVVCDPPDGVDLADGLTVRPTTNSPVLSIEAKYAIAGVGTMGDTTDIHLIFVNALSTGDGVLLAGTAVAEYWYRSSSEAPYLYNMFISASTSQPAGLVIGHELGHLLTNRGHAEEMWRLMYKCVVSNGVKGTLRLVDEEEIRIHGDSHVQAQ